MPATKIEWTEATWNPITGCTRVSPGCDNCYAARQTRRLEGMGLDKYHGLTTSKHFNGQVRCHEDVLAEPLRRKKPTLYFVCSMSDPFHPSVPDEFLLRLWEVMRGCFGRHTFILLTKRPARMADVVSRIRFDGAGLGHLWMTDDAADTRGYPLGPGINGGTGLLNVWLGTSIENQAAADERIPHLLDCPAAVRFLSCEPLLGPLDVRRWIEWSGGCANCGDGDYWGGPCCDEPLKIEDPRIDWVIVGGESGPGARPMHPAWARSIRDQCAAAGVPFFFKHWGEWVPEEQCDVRSISAGNRHQIDHGNGTFSVMYRIGKKAAGRLLDGRTHDATPGDFRLQISD